MIRKPGKYLLALVCFGGFSFASANETKMSPEEKQTRQLFEAQCYRCHSHQAGKSKGSLMLDARSSLLKGGETGPALIPGQPEQSLLFKALSHQDEQLRMPPKTKLSDDEINIVRAWIKAGAPWTESADKQKHRIVGSITEEDRRYWAYQPLKKVAIPDVVDNEWSMPVDRFILDRLQREKIKPAPQAEKRALIRRLTYDLTGLPPTPTEVDAFLADTSESAYEQLVERLLSSPHYGEHWARHWFDVVRYAESDGFRLDEYRPDAWRYRDYVIRAFNDDKPYDQFVREQIAGDEIAPDNPEARAATGFLAMGIYEYNQRDARTQWSDMLNEIADVTGETFLGLSMGCARCHDHKFDPILQKDYFAFRAFFVGLMPSEKQPFATQAEIAEHARKQAVWLEKTAKIRAEIEAIEGPEKLLVTETAIKKFPDDIKTMMRKPENERSPIEKQLAALAYRQIYYEFDKLDGKIKGDAKTKLLELRQALAKFDADKPAPLPTCFAVRNVEPAPPPTTIPKRSEPIAPAFLTVLGDEAPMLEKGRRTALANWLTRPEHPLTARVVVNRVWQAHFGRGLVATANDFGRLGDPPSHPELLDWLAQQFIDEGWSFKKLHRHIVLSRTYRQSATAAAESIALQQDSENRYRWRTETRRLEAEQIRDSLLATIGKLDLKTGGPSADLKQPRRSVYLKNARNTREPLMEVFDLPEPYGSTGKRNVTTTSTQALQMMNSTPMRDYAQAFADRLSKDVGSDERARIERAFLLCFGRPATDQEVAGSLQFLARQSKLVQPEIKATTDDVAKLPFREGRAAVLTPNGPQSHFEITKDAKLPQESFTLEAFVMLRSVFEDGMVRTIAAHGNTEGKNAGWIFGVTGTKSAYKPQMLVLLIAGEDDKEKHQTETLFSGLQLKLNKPYYVAIAVDLKETDEKGITFFAKDLSNDEEPMLTYPIGHKIVKRTVPAGPFAIGGMAGKSERNWDGLIDDVRLSRGVLSQKQFLMNTDIISESTVGYWRFEPEPGMLRDSSSSALHLQRHGISVTSGTRDPRQLAFIDFCQALLNANEFLYVE